MTTTIDWRTRVGDVWAEEWPRTDRALADLATHLDVAVLDAAPAGPFTALDIGSGAGATSLALAAARPDATVLGVDLSPALVNVAQHRARDVPNCCFRQGEATQVAAEIRPDLLVSRHGVMFFADPHAAFTALRKAVEPGARLVFTCFAAVTDNSWATLITAAPSRSNSYVPGPFAFAEPQQGRTFLRRAGWDGAAQRVDFRYRVGEGADPVADAAGFLTRIGPAASALRDADPKTRPALEAKLLSRLERARRGDVIDFPAAAWLWTATAGAGNPA